MSDSELLRKLARGDMEALGSLYDRHAARVYHWLLAQGLAEAEAQDLLQEVFLALVQRGRKVARVQSALGYLLGIARKLTARQRKQRPTLADEPSEAAADLPDPTAVLAARAAVQQLPPEQAEVVVLKVWHDMTFAEIAEALGIPANTAASRYRYGLEKLRAIWGVPS